MKIVNKFLSAKDAMDYIGVRTVRQTALGIQLKSNGYYFCYVDDYFDDWKPREHKKRCANYEKPVYQLDKKTLKIIKKFKSVKEASEKTNTNLTGISPVCNGERQTSGGFKWRWAS